MFKRKKVEFEFGSPMPEKFIELAQYNAEKSRGLLHTTHKKNRMRILQEEFDIWIIEQGPKQGNDY